MDQTRGYDNTNIHQPTQGHNGRTQNGDGTVGWSNHDNPTLSTVASSIPLHSGIPSNFPPYMTPSMPAAASSPHQSYQSHGQGVGAPTMGLTTQQSPTFSDPMRQNGHVLPNTNTSMQEVELELDQVYDPLDPTVASTTEYLSSYAIPNDQATANNSPLPLGVLFSPTVHLHPPPPRFHAQLQQCQRCHAAINIYCRMAQTTDGHQRWICALCGTQQVFRSEINQYVQAPSAQQSPLNTPAPLQSSIPAELAYKVIETVTPMSSHAAILPPTVFPASARPIPGVQTPHPRATGAGMNYVFLIDRTIPKSDFSDLKRQLTALAKELPGEAGIALLTFSNTVSIYDLTQLGVSACTVFGGDSSPSREALEGFIQEHGVVFPRVSRVLDTFLECLESLEQQSSTIEQQKLLNPRAMGAAIEWATAIVQGGREYDSLVCRGGVSSSPHSASYTSTSSPIGSFAFTHSLIITSGPPDFGPGETTLEVATQENQSARVYYDELAKRTRTNGMQIEYCVQGMGHFAVPIVRKLVDPTGGSIYMHKHFDDTFLSDLRSCLFRSIGYNGRVDMFFSSGMTVRRVIGGVAEMRQMDDETKLDESNGENGTASSVHHLQLQLSNCRPDESIAIYYALKEDLPQDYVHMQFVLTYTDWNHQCSVQVRDICQHFGRERPERNQTQFYELPQELNLLPLLLYHVRRGTLLGPILQHPDDIDVARYIFLHANRTDAIRAIMPTLIAFNHQGGIEELPLETLALQSNRILLLDHQTQILIWSGAAVTSSAYDSYRRACHDRAAAHSRFRLPRPEILSFNENSSASRWMQVRLMPSHKDAEEWQNLTFPQLKTMTNEHRRELIEKFLPTDEPSFMQFYSQLFGTK